MRFVLRFLSHLSLALWVGALVFFVLGVAAVAFSVLPPLFASSAEGLHAAGAVVALSLGRLHMLGLACGAVFLVASILGAALGQSRYLAGQLILVVLMMVITALSQWVVIPRMEAARASVPGGEIASVPQSNPARQTFEALHIVSTRAEALVLIFGLATLAISTAGDMRPAVRRFTTSASEVRP